MEMYVLKCDRVSQPACVHTYPASEPLNCQTWGVRKTITAKCACCLSFIFYRERMEGEEKESTKDKMREVGKS